jgi:glycosyl transferase family 25
MHEINTIVKESEMIKSYVINLDKDTERLQFFSDNFKRLGLEFERISAVNGRNFSEEDYQNFMQLRPRNNKSWLRGQMGCFLSHFTAWQLIANGTEEYCAVFEDDVHISDDLKKIIENESWIPQNADIIRLETSTNRIRLSSSPVIEHSGRSAYKVMSTSWNAGAYILSKGTAQKLVELPLAQHQPSDILLFHFSESPLVNRLQILQFHPALCTQDKHHANSTNQFASNIEFSDADVSRLIVKFKNYTPRKIWQSLRKSSQGYKRIEFQ